MNQAVVNSTITVLFSGNQKNKFILTVILSLTMVARVDYDSRKPRHKEQGNAFENKGRKTQMQRVFLILLALSALLFSSATWGQAHQALAQGALTPPFVDNIRFEKGTRIAYVRIINPTAKEITGINLSIDVTYQNGQKHHYERMVDFLPRILSSQKQSLADDGALHPGGWFEERLDLPSHGGPDNLAVGVLATLDVATYADATATVENHNEDALTRIMTHRRERVLADRKAEEIINAALADTVTPDPQGVAIAQLRCVLEQSKHKSGEHELDVQLMAIISDLEMMSNTSTPSRSELRRYAQERHADSETTSTHAHLTKGVR